MPKRKNKPAPDAAQAAREQEARDLRLQEERMRAGEELTPDGEHVPEHPTLFQRLDETLRAYQKRDPAARSRLSVLLLYQGVHATINHRIAHWFYVHHHFFIARWISQRSRHRTGIEIHPGAVIGRRFVIDHGMGIVIGETAEVGDDVLIYHGVTLGGTGKDQGKRHPTIGNNVLIGCGAKVLGPFKVGDNSRIASNSVVLTEVPPDSTAVGVPARLVRIAGQRVNYASEVDQIHITDPVQKTLDSLLSRVEALERQLEKQYTEGLANNYGFDEPEAEDTSDNSEKESRKD